MSSTRYVVIPSSMYETRNGTVRHPNVTHVEFSSRADDVRAGLVDTFLNLERIDNDLYLARHLLKGRQSLPAVYGGQVVGQSLAAASATIDPIFIPHSLHSYFIKTGSVYKPILYMVDRVRDGRSFCTRIVKAIQDGDAIFTAQISFHKKEPDAIKHSQEMPKVPEPDNLRDARELTLEYLNTDEPSPYARSVLEHQMKEVPPAFERVFEFRPVDANRFLMKTEDGPCSMIWLKAKENLGEDINLHHCVAAYITDINMITTSLRPHVREGFVPSMTFSLDHNMWMHTGEFRMDDWMLYETNSPIAKGSRSFIEGRLWTRDGQLVLSTAQEALVRTLPSKQ